MAPADDERTTSGTGNLADATVGLTVRAPHGMVAAADHLASSAGVDALRAGGTAADAAVAAGAVLAVTNQHQCGLGGDLFALVARPGEPVAALCAAGRAGSGADAAPLRADGLERMPPQGDVRAATVPGCVDGLIELHGRFGRLPLAHVLATAAAYPTTPRGRISSRRPRGWPAPIAPTGCSMAPTARRCSTPPGWPNGGRRSIPTAGAGSPGRPHRAEPRCAVPSTGTAPASR